MAFPFRQLLGSIALLLTLGASLCSAGEVLRYAGATTLAYGFMPEAAQLFEQETGTAIAINGGNTDLGLAALQEGNVDLVGSGRFLSEAEKSSGLVETLIGWDPLAVVIPRSNPIENLTLEQLRGIFRGSITNWQEVGGRDLPVIPVIPPKGAAIRTALEEALLHGAPFSRQAVIVMVTPEADQQVEQLPSAITVTSRSMVDAADVKIIQLNGMQPPTFSLDQHRYPLIKPLLLVTRGVPKGQLAGFLSFVASPAGRTLLAKKFIPVLP